MYCESKLLVTLRRVESRHIASLRSNVKRDSARDLEGTIMQEKLKSCWIRTKSEVNNLPVNTNLNSELKGALFKSFYFCAIKIFAGLRSSLFLFVI